MYFTLLFLKNILKNYFFNPFKTNQTLPTLILIMLATFNNTAFCVHDKRNGS